MEVILVTVYQNLEQNGREKLHRFHFKGVCRGEVIKDVYLGSSQVFTLGDEYILHVKVNKISGRNLYGNILRSKNIKYLQRDFL